jgi:quercetin dioxygenase-like cupin family protein
MEVFEQGEGWVQYNVANAEVMGAPVISARLWKMQAGATSPERTQGSVERIFIIIAGSGTANVGTDKFDLAPEGMLWLEEGDTYWFEAGDTGLEMMENYAPGD